MSNFENIWEGVIPALIFNQLNDIPYGPWHFTISAY